MVMRRRSTSLSPLIAISLSAGLIGFIAFGKACLPLHTQKAILKKSETVSSQVTRWVWVCVLGGDDEIEQLRSTPIE